MAKLHAVVLVREFLHTSLTPASTPLAQNLATELLAVTQHLMMATALMIVIVTERMWRGRLPEVPMGLQPKRPLFPYEFLIATAPDLLLASLLELTGLFNTMLLVLQQWQT